MRSRHRPELGLLLWLEICSLGIIVFVVAVHVIGAYVGPTIYLALSAIPVFLYLMVRQDQTANSPRSGRRFLPSIRSRRASE